MADNNTSSYDDENTDTEDVGTVQSDVGHEPLPPLPQDNDTPFSPANDPSTDAVANDDVQIDESTLDPTHQITDTNIEQEETYDEGLTGAAEASEPNAGNDVADYNPEKDSRKKSDR